MPPHGIKEIRALLGDPRAAKDEASWCRAILAPVPLPAPTRNGAGNRVISQLWVHEQIVDEVTAALGTIEATGNWGIVKTIACYAWRPARGLQKLSLHTWAAALDINQATNRLGTVGDMPPDLVQAFEGLAWTWGGRWRRPDPMHFQFATGY